MYHYVYICICILGVSMMAVNCKPAEETGDKKLAKASNNSDLINEIENDKLNDTTSTIASTEMPVDDYENDISEKSDISDCDITFYSSKLSEIRNNRKYSLKAIFGPIMGSLSGEITIGDFLNDFFKVVLLMASALMIDLVYS